VHSRDDKIARMQGSMSWRITAPLRLLRRAFFDRLPQRQGSASCAAGQGAASYFCSVDRPSIWTDMEARRVNVAGWIVRADGQRMGGVRLRVGDAGFTAATGIRRLDVKAAIPENGAAEKSGFSCDIRLDGSRGLVVVEALSPAGRWDTVYRVEYTLAPDATEVPCDPFTRWMVRCEDLSEGAFARMRDTVATWSPPPLISVVVPVYNTPEKWLTAAIDSVRRQAYPHWELCIADDASPAPHVRPLLERAAREDARIKVVFRETNGHICAASNSALALATGEWVALLDHDDELAPHALFEMAAATRAHPDAALIYSDEDKIDETGRRFDPYFKPDFLPDLLEGQNFICHLGAYRTALVRELGGFREGFEGSQDWDLALRVADRAGTAAIRHVPRILYHWRAIAGSTALHGDQKNYHLSAARRALADHFDRRGERVELVEIPGGHWRARHAVPEPHPLVSIIIPTRNGLHLIRRCVESIEEKTSYDRFEILIVDNGSDDPAMLAWLRDMQARHPGERGRVRVLRDESPFNYSALNNRAVTVANGDFVCLLNNDMEVVSPDWIDEMVSHAARPGAGCVGAMLYYPDDVIQHAGVVLGVGGVAGHAFKRFPRGSEGVFNRARLVQNYSAVTAACLLVRKSIFLSVGGLDEKELSVAFNDVDFCLKVRAAGHRNVWTPFAEFYHHESASRGFEDTPEKTARFRREIEVMQQRWGTLLTSDPAYNPNLSLEGEDFAIATSRRAGSGS
jgi:O-antigen biosynthesis protein